MAVNSYSQFQFNQYTPKTFQEMLAPVQYVTEQEDKLQEQYGESASNIDKTLAAMNPELDKESYNKLSKYRQDVVKAADDLATKGFIDSGRKTNLYNLKKTYDTEYASTLNQLNQRAGVVAMQQQQALKDPTYRFKSAANISIDEAKNNPNLWNDLLTKGGVSGAYLQQQVATQAATLKNSIKDKAPQLTNLKYPDGKPLLNQYIMMMTSGAKDKEIFAAINGITKSPEVSAEIVTQLRGIVDNVMQNNNVDVTFGKDSAEYQDLRGIANQGLFQAIGEEKITPYTDQAGMARYNANLDMEMYKKKAEIQFNQQRAEAQLQSKQQRSLYDLWRPITDTGLDPKRKDIIEKRDMLETIRNVVTKGEKASPVKIKTRSDETNRTWEEKTSEYLESLDRLQRLGISIQNADGSRKSDNQLVSELNNSIKILDKEDNKYLTTRASFSINKPEGVEVLTKRLLNAGVIHELKSNGTRSDKVLQANPDNMKETEKLETMLKGSEFIIDAYNNKAYLKRGTTMLEVDLQKFDPVVYNNLKTLSTNLKQLDDAMDKNGLDAGNLDNPDKSVVYSPYQLRILEQYENLKDYKADVLNQIGTVLTATGK